MGELVPRAGAAGPRRQAVTATAVRGLSRFAAARGIPAGREFLLDYDVIEAFCVAGPARPGVRPPGAPTGRRCTGSRGRCTACRAAGDAVRGREGAGAVLAGRARRAGRRRGRPARSGETGLGAGPGGVRHRRRAAARRAGGAARQRRHPARPAGGRACQRPAGAGGAGHRALMPGGRPGWPPARETGSPVPARPGGPRLQELRHQLRPHPGRDPAAPRLTPEPVPVQLHLRSPGRGHPGARAAGHHRHLPGRIAGPLRTPRRRRPAQGRAAGLGQDASRRAEHGRRRAGHPRARQRPGRAGRGVCRRADRPQRAGPGHRGRAGPPHRAAPPAAGARRAHRAAVPGPG